MPLSFAKEADFFLGQESGTKLEVGIKWGKKECTSILAAGAF